MKNNVEIIKNFIILIFMVFFTTFFISPFYMIFLLTRIPEHLVDKVFIISIGLLHMVIYILYLIKVKREKKNEKL